MTTYAALLRGINVGGKRVPMADLRAILESLGHGDVRTYLQSGNAVFTSDERGERDGPDERAESDERDERRIADGIAEALAKHFGFPVDVLVRGHAYLKAVADACPFPAAELEGKQLHVTYLSEPVDADRFAHLDQDAFLPEAFRLGDRALYLYAPDGLGRSKLAEALAKPRLYRGIVATSRNWNTVAKLVEMTRA
ncbi:DUF1697 domain-containing protein [Streptomyces sp. NPDC058001]|uniref:DUF1697 domain-containing protein n=1 Tax=Streptomyces sp. NPDC058001 TaxID=3346300 RepID=UPI0036EF7757